MAYGFVCADTRSLWSLSHVHGVHTVLTSAYTFALRISRMHATRMKPPALAFALLRAHVAQIRAVGLNRA